MYLFLAMNIVTMFYAIKVGMEWNGICKLLSEIYSILVLAKLSLFEVLFVNWCVIKGHDWELFKWGVHISCCIVSLYQYKII